MKLKKSFTLIELLLYMAIVAIILGALTQISWNLILSGEKSAVQQEVFAGGRLLAEKIKYEIRNAKDINTSLSTFDTNLVSSPGSKLSLAEDAPNNPTEIDVLSGKVRIKRGASAVVNLNSTGTSVTNLTFRNYSSADNKTKHIGFTLTLIANGTREEYKQSITIESSAEWRSNPN
jgi:hypothetical protein